MPQRRAAQKGSGVFFVLLRVFAIDLRRGSLDRVPKDGKKKTPDPLSDASIEPAGDGQSMLKYLMPYVYRVPISENRNSCRTEFIPLPCPSLKQIKE
jgi:hypothetical protein